jgi:ABC-type multidrug transport system ATPase subunit
MLLKNPELVLLDEPFSGLDSNGCQEMKELIATLSQSGKTVILSGDSLCFAKDVSSRLLLFSAGRVEASGTLAQLLDTPGALRFLGQLLPEPTAHRVLQTLREDLLVPQAQSAIPEAVPVQEIQTISQAVLPRSCESASSADQVLRTLLKSAPVDPRSGPPSEPTTHVNHDLLAALSKPALANPPPRSAEE